MGLFSVGPFRFVDWRGSPPQLVGEMIASHARPGVDGVGLQAIGAHGMQFEAELTAWFGGGTAAVNFHLAKNAVAQYQGLRGYGLVPVVYAGLSYADAYRHAYTVEMVTEVETRVAVRLFGNGVNYPSGAVLVVRFRMTPHQIPTGGLPES